MGKRSNFDRKSKDFYETPLAPMGPLLPHLPTAFAYIDPCCGGGAIPHHLMYLIEDSFCVGRYDLYPKLYDRPWVSYDATTKQYPDLDSEMFITNPPWDRKILHPIIDNLASQKPTWLLFDADWMHTKQSAEYMKYCVKIVSVGRVKWFPDSNSVGKDNCAWYLFDKNHTGETVFVGRPYHTNEE